MVWAKALWTTVGGKNFPPFLLFIKDNMMKELSVFIDESGDFGEIKERPAYYLVTTDNENNPRLVIDIPAGYCNGQSVAI